jgi:hypothetical protein
MRRPKPLLLVGWTLLLATGIFGLHLLKWTHVIDNPLIETLVAAGGQLAALVSLMLLALFHAGSSKSRGEPGENAH